MHAPLGNATRIFRLNASAAFILRLLSSIPLRILAITVEQMTCVAMREPVHNTTCCAGVLK